ARPARPREQGFEVLAIAAATARADALALLIPDEVQRDVYARDIAPNLRAGQMLDFAPRYNPPFGLIRPPATVDVIMVAPRMIGINVRRSYERGAGVPAYVAVAQDVSGHARSIAVAGAKAV